jgi:outer membrane protein assembly factor BamB
MTRRLRGTGYYIVVFGTRTATSCVVFAVLMATVASGQQPKRNVPPPPLPLLPAQQSWLTTLDSQPSAGGAMDAERAYVVLQTRMMVAIDRQTGAIVWTRPMESMWPPVVGEGIIYVAETTAIHALDPATGDERWQTPLSEPLATALTRSGDALLAIAEPSEAIAMRAADGSVIWRQPLGARSRHAPVANGARVFFALEDGRVAALSLLDGARDWERPLAGTLSLPAVIGDRVFVGSDKNDFYSLDHENGSIKWKWRTGGDVIGADGDGAGHVFFASLDNLLRSVNLGSGNQQWRKEMPSRPAIPPRVVADVVIIAGVAPIITSYDTKKGMVVGTYTAPGELAGPPLIDPVLKPYRVAMVVITRDGRVAGLSPIAMLFKEPALAPLGPLPGSHVSREPPP